METRSFVHIAKQSIGASALIISPASEPEQFSQQFSGNTAIAHCPNRDCHSTQINLVVMPSESTHYAARRCATCNLFIGWEMKPATKEKRQQQQSTIRELLKSPQLSQWERSFLDGLKGSKISPKQQEVLIRIEAKVGGLA